MRVYALLLGILFTTGYGYAAQIAVSSLKANPVTATEPAATLPAGGALDGVWYGVVLAPVTVESRSDGTIAAATQGEGLRRPIVRSTGAARSRFHAQS